MRASSPWIVDESTVALGVFQVKWQPVYYTICILLQSINLEFASVVLLAQRVIYNPIHTIVLVADQRGSKGSVVAKVDAEMIQANWLSLDC